MPPDGAMNLRGPPMDASAGSPPRIDHITALVSHSETGQYSCRVKQPPPPPLRNGSSAGHIRHSSGDDDDAQNIRRSARASGPRPTGSNPSNSGEVDEQSSLKFASSRKRQKLAGGRMAYPRKRAITACQLCRIRKSKCDNLRPSCGSCSSLDVECIYQTPDSDHSSFDNASLAILNRVNYAIELIENQSLTLKPDKSFNTSPPTNDPVRARSDTLATTKSPSDGFTARSHASIDESRSPEALLDSNSSTLTEALDLASYTSSSHILVWPVFKGKVDPNDITALFFDPTSPQTAPATPNDDSYLRNLRSIDRGVAASQGIREEDVPVFIQDFLLYVHTKNPILDPPSLKAMARTISKDGFQWDGPSCIVLIACALANLARPFNLSRPEEHESSRVDARDYTTAESYYTASRKRIGLLSDYVLTTQCLFLAGVYEMYSLRPLRAWLSFNHACTTFQTYLHTHSHKSVQNRSSRRVEQRLYWSCLKSECEMRDEIELPPTGLAKVEYSDVFPSPPGGTPVPEDQDEAMVPSGLELAFQRSWYYYLSEIALRRIANRISHTFYSMEPCAWHTISLKRMQRIAQELDAQILQWSENIPRFLAFEDKNSTDELSFMLQARFLDLRERIYRPFLYIVIHNNPIPAEQATVMACARRCLELVFLYIRHSGIKHRHHGSWYVARQLFAKSLLVLAAVKSGQIIISEDWSASLAQNLRCLKYWEDEAPDLYMARTVLTTLYTEIVDS